MSNVPSAEELDVSFQAFKDVVTHPEFQKAFEEVQSLPEDQRLDAASTQLAAQALAARGVPISPGMHITTPDFGNIDEAGAIDGSPQFFQACIWLFGHKICVDLPIISLPE